MEVADDEVVLDMVDVCLRDSQRTSCCEDLESNVVFLLQRWVHHSWDHLVSHSSSLLSSDPEGNSKLRARSDVTATSKFPPLQFKFQFMFLGRWIPSVC